MSASKGSQKSVPKFKPTRVVVTSTKGTQSPLSQGSVSKIRKAASKATASKSVGGKKAAATKSKS